MICCFGIELFAEILNMPKTLLLTVFNFIQYVLKTRGEKYIYSKSTWICHLVEETAYILPWMDGLELDLMHACCFSGTCC
jgi:hypothetical protein